MPERKLEDLFLITLRDVYGSETQILSALQHLAEAARDAELKAAFEDHLDESRAQVRRLEKVFALVDEQPVAQNSEAIAGLVAACDAAMIVADRGAVCDAGLVAAVQAVEHYEIARYGTLVAWAKQLGLEEAADLLAETLEEEKNADETLNRLALSSINRQAA